MQNYRVILDTDIGGDIDDAFALALLLRCPEVALNEVTTVDGDVAARARVARAMLAAGGRAAVPVADGCGGTLSPRRQEEHLLTYGGRQTGDGGMRVGPESAIRALTGSAADVLFAIGPLTNVAVALACRPGALAGTRVVAMAGEFERDDLPEFNVRCDAVAADRVFSGGVPVDVIPLAIGLATKLDEADVRRLEGGEDPLVILLVEWLHEFWHNERSRKTNMYDPMTVVALLRPELFEWRRGRVTVELRDEKLYGLTRFEADERGPHRVAFGVRAAEAKAFMLERLLAVARAV